MEVREDCIEPPALGKVPDRIISVFATNYGREVSLVI